MAKRALYALAKAVIPARIRDLRKVMLDDWEAYGGDWTLPGWRALTVYRFGVFADKIHSRILRAVAMRAYLTMYRWIRNHHGVELDHTAKVGRRLILGHQGNIVIHPFATIGDDCLIRHNVTIGAAVHRNYTTEEFAATAPTLEDGVQVGCTATILGRVVIGRGAHIGPNALVISDVPAGATVFAAPSRVMLPPVSKRDLARQQEDT